jgi:hypothetical protein
MTEKRFFCIRGFMKSGTNWLGALLNRHPEVSSAGEFHWQELLDPLQRQGQNLAVYRKPGLFKSTLDRMRQVIREGIVQANDPNAIVVGDRTPHSLKPLILPEAHYISIIRDGRDVMVSRMFHLLNNPGVTRIFQRNRHLRGLLDEFRNDPWFFDKSPELLLSIEEPVRVTARWWREHLESDRQTVRENPELQVRFLRYEDLHVNPELICKELFEFLGVDPTLANPIEGQTAPGFSEGRPDSFFRKGVVGDWKNYFNDDSRSWFDDEAGDELRELGYVGDNGGW